MTQQNNPTSATALRVLGPRTVAQLVTTIPVNLPDGALCWVTDLGALYRYSRESTAPLNAYALPAGNPAGTYGRWLRLGASDVSFAQCTGIIANGAGIAFTAAPTGTLPASLAGTGLSSDAGPGWAQAGAVDSPNFTFTGPGSLIEIRCGVAAATTDVSPQNATVFVRKVFASGAPSQDIDLAFLYLEPASTPTPFRFFGAERLMGLATGDALFLGFRAEGGQTVDVVVNQLYLTLRPL